MLSNSKKENGEGISLALFLSFSSSSFFFHCFFLKSFFLLLFCFHKFYFYFSFLSSFPSLQLPLVVPKQVVGFQKIPPLDLQVQLLRIRDLLVPEVA